LKLNYHDAINYLFNRLPMFQRIGPAAYKNSLGNILALDKLYGNPHKKFQSVHIAGTNGKGSVAHMLAAVLQESGYKTGLYTSPHLKDFRERIKINGKCIKKEEIIGWIENFRINNKWWKIEPSFFELTVALAFDYFAKQKVDIAIIEVGLGGRLDSTNIITPEVSIITNIGLDHVNLLGNTLQKIAVEKAGIVKPNVPLVVGTTQNEIKSVFIEKTQESGSEIYFADKEYKIDYAMLGIDGKQILHIKQDGIIKYPQLKLDLLGAYQQKNVPAVLKTIQLLEKKGWSVSESSIYSGLQSVIGKTGLKGRWQVIGNNPLIICDTGHNEDGVEAIVRQIENTAFKTLHFIFGSVSDKEPDRILRLLPKNAQYYFVRAKIPRAMDEQLLAEKAAIFGLSGRAYPSVIEALDFAKIKADKRDLIFIGGSTFVVAEIL